MNEGHPNHRAKLQFNLKRSLYGWFGAALSLAALAWLACWIVTIAWRGVEVPALGVRGGFVSAAKGSISLGSDFGETIQTMDDYADTASDINPPISDRRLDLPGFHCRVQGFRDASTDWLLDMSILIPFLGTALMAALCLYRYRAICGRENL